MSYQAPSAASLRLMSDLKLMQKDPPDGSSACLLREGDLFEWTAVIFGPPGTTWEGGVFHLRLSFSDRYPDKAPSVRFTSKIFHPNVYKDGKLCLDVIEHNWSPIYTINTLLTSIQSLLTDPNPSSAANPEAAQLYTEDRAAYKKKIRECVN